MVQKKTLGLVAAGMLAGAINGLFGAGGGMVLVPLLSALTALKEEEIFPASVSIILPVSVVSLCFSLSRTAADCTAALPYLIGSAAGGVSAGIWGRKLPVKWLHRSLGILILWGGFRYLC